MPPTEQQIMSLEAGPEADELAALHVMGWRLVGGLWLFGNIGVIACSKEEWQPSDDQNDAHDLESELERRGFTRAYGENVCRVVKATANLMNFHFSIIHASPLARVKAALLCVAKETT